VDRDIVRIITPGTLIETSMLDEGKSNYLCALYVSPDDNAACFADVSTGEISGSYFTGTDIGHLLNEIAAFGPAEAVLNRGAYHNAAVMAILCEKLGDEQLSDEHLIIRRPPRALPNSLRFPARTMSASETAVPQSAPSARCSRIWRKRRRRTCRT
jgi:DNA mismatch repair ATPase MutS